MGRGTGDHSGGYENDHGPVAGILALDNGPGIADVPQAMSDGYSTAGTMGGGMGAMKRIANSLEIFTAANGTIVFLEMACCTPQRGLQVAGLAIPYPGERLSGDAWACHQTPERTVVLLVDGLGHGREAAEARSEAVATFGKRVATHARRDTLLHP